MYSVIVDLFVTYAFGHVDKLPAYNNLIDALYTQDLWSIFKVSCIHSCS